MSHQFLSQALLLQPEGPLEDGLVRSRRRRVLARVRVSCGRPWRTVKMPHDLQLVRSEQNAVTAYLTGPANAPQQVKIMRAMLVWLFVVTIPLSCSTRREQEQGDCRLLGPADRMLATLLDASGTRLIGSVGPP